MGVDVGILMICFVFFFFFFFFKQKTAYEMLRSLVGSEMCIRDRAQIISYNFLKSGCIDRGLVSSEDAWLYPEEIQVRNENLMNFALKTEPSIPIGPDCLVKLITSIPNDPRGWNNIR